MKESITQHDENNFSITLIDKNNTFTQYNLNRNKTIKALALLKLFEDIGKDHSLVCDRHLCGRWHGVNIKNLLESMP